MDLLSITRRLCAIDTATGVDNTQQIIEVCCSAAPKGTELQTQRSSSPSAADDFSLQRRGSGVAKILLLGHYDTVPGLRVDQQLDGDRLIAAGSYDMKGGIAIALRLFSQLEREKFSELTLYLAGDEELRQQPLIIPGRWDAILAFEGGEKNGVVINRFGADIVQLQVLGAKQRASHPPEEPSTIQVLAKLLGHLEVFNSDQAHLTASQLSAAAAINVIPEKAQAAGVFRYLSRQQREKFQQALPTKIDNLEVEYDFQQLIPPLSATDVSQALLRQLGITALTRSGASDISWLQGQAPIMIDGLGPLGGAEHSEQEYIIASSLPTQLALAQRIIDSIVG